MKLPAWWPGPCSGPAGVGRGRGVEDKGRGSAQLPAQSKARGKPIDGAAEARAEAAAARDGRRRRQLGSAETAGALSLGLLPSPSGRRGGLVRTAPRAPAGATARCPPGAVARAGGKTQALRRRDPSCAARRALPPSPAPPPPFSPRTILVISAICSGDMFAICCCAIRIISGENILAKLWARARASCDGSSIRSPARSNVNLKRAGYCTQALDRL